MSEYKPSLEEFLKDVETHTVEVLLDQGFYRHLRCRRAENPIWLHWFDIVTAPDLLLIRGDMGSVSFSRIEDMFKFFSSDPAKINPHYWAEKIQALARQSSSGAMVWDGDVFKQALVDSLQDYGVVGEHRKEIEDKLESEIEWRDDESYVRRQVDQFEHDGFCFVDTHEISGEVYLSCYIWLIRAICWSIGQYEQRKKGSAAAAAAEVVHG